MSPFESIEYWHWWIVAGVLVLLELATQGLFFLCLGIAAGVTGIILLYMPLSILYQLVLFALLAGLAVLIWRFYLKRSAA
mgnify:CR=1 FL=1